MVNEDINKIEQIVNNNFKTQLPECLKQLQKYVEKKELDQYSRYVILGYNLAVKDTYETLKQNGLIKEKLTPPKSFYTTTT